MTSGAGSEGSGGRLQRVLARVAALAIVAAGLGGAWWLHVESGIEWERESLRQQFADFGAIAPALFVLAVAFRPLLGLPSFVVLAAGGVLFGATQTNSDPSFTGGPETYTRVPLSETEN